MRPAVLLLVPALFGAAACNRAPDPATTAAGGNRPGLVEVPARQLSQIGIARVHPTEWDAEIRTTGTVDWDGDHTTQVIAQTNGPVTRIVADLGRHVSAGQPLLYVASPDLASAVATYRKAENRLDLARRILDRNKDLLSHHVIAQKDLDASEADYNDAFTDAQNALDALRILGFDTAQIAEAERQNQPVRAETALRSPIAGVVVQKSVLPGQLVQAGTTNCFTVSDTATVWVQGHLHGDELSAVRVGDQVEVRSDVAATPFHGVVSSVGAALDPATRTTPVRIATRNPGGLLKKDAFVELLVRTAAASNVLTVPASAILYSNENLPFVYRQVEPGRFARAIVRLGGQRGQFYEVLSGLKDGDAVVAQGGVFLQFAETVER